MDTFIFGIHPVIEALKSGTEINKIFIRKGLLSDAIGQLINLAKPLNIPVQFIPQERFNKYTRKNHQGVLAIVSPVEYQPWEEVLHRVFASGRDPLFLVLDGITDVRNFGAIARTAECTGVDAIIITTTNNPGITADAVKTSAGALNTVPVCRVKYLSDTLKALRQSGLSIVACTRSNDTPYIEADFNRPLAIVMGSEDKGIEPVNLNQCELNIGIPVFGSLDSLNVSVATGVVVYEVLRQRNLIGKQ
ncbi:MAG TPA: 23S rRNA (guanosine(2251)-2'-O)-methyltransferase RlmB [Bacteroidales bacterium]|nr:23S rRNA (guanosine(2251)-2'-O)-methyltransferase RlmB [Bacteroidales bacterium]HQL70205.1 23S rRNA (guanosine(2251)-2'-O)-methyltransferase RlmB [Bacteroidales bacterium]